MHSINRKRVSALVVLAGCASVAPVVFGDNWINGSGGSWGDGTNWSNGVVPTTATFNLGSSGYTVTLPGTETVTTLVVDTDNPTLSLGGNFLEMGTHGNLAPFQVAPTSGDVGSLTVNGPGTVLGAGLLRISVGSGGTGQLIVNGATINADGNGASLSESSGGSITVENGGLLESTSGSPVNLAGAETLNDGNVYADSNLTIAGATLSNSSSLSGMGNVTVNGSVSLDASTFGSSSGSVTFNSGTVTLTDGSMLTAELGLTLPTTTNNVSSKVIVFGGTLTFSGTTTIQLSESTSNPFGGLTAAYGGVLDFTLQNGFMPTVGEQFDIFNFRNAPSGTFSAVNLPVLPVSEAWDTSQLYTTGVISVVPEPTGIVTLGMVGLGILSRRRRTDCNL